MARGRKKKVEQKADVVKETMPIEIPGIELDVDESTESETKLDSRMDTGIKIETEPREPRYFIVKGSFTAGNTVIGPMDKHRPGDEPGQMRPEYTPGGVEALEHWVRAGYMVKK